MLATVATLATLTLILPTFTTTVPGPEIATIWLDGPLILGLEATQMVLLLITVIVSVLTVVPGRATLQQAGVHLVLFFAFLFLAVSP